LLATIKVHSSFSPYFDQLELKADFNTYFDVIPYLSAMHPRFKNYMDSTNWEDANESFAFLDKDLNLLNEDDLHIRRVKEDDVIHLAPIVLGGGGKRGGLFALIAIGVFAFATGGFGLAAAPTVGSGVIPAGTSTMAGGVAGSSGGFFGGLMKGFSAMPGFARSIFGNIAMGLVTSLFTKKKKNTEVDSSTRQAGAFGSLTNTTENGTPIPLIYGQHRVAGHMLSGYIDSEDHGKNDVIRVGDKF